MTESAVPNETVETITPPIARPRRFHFGWVPLAFFRPRELFRRIAGERQGVWLTPLLLLTAAALLRVIVAGFVLRGAAGAATLPPDFEYFSPEQQTQYMQAAELTSGPVFTFIFPSISAVLGVWLGWLIVGGALHLAATLLGGRGNIRRTLSIVAWAGMPFVLRDLVRMVAVLASRQALGGPGLSGFVAADAAGFALYLRTFLTAIDLYLIWHVALLALGDRGGDPSLRAGRTAVSVVGLMIMLLAIRAGMAFGMAQLGNLTVMRPFYF